MSNFLQFLVILIMANHVLGTITPTETVHIHDETFNDVVSIKGNQYDGLLIENCIFENIADHGLRVENVENVVIRSNIFRNIDGNGIQMKNDVYTKNVTIIDNVIEHTGKNGIVGGEQHDYTIIARNLIHDFGLDESYCVTGGAPCHGIYWQGPYFDIRHNHIHTARTANGNCVSIRTHGHVTGNLLYNSLKNGISYYSDHPGYGGTLYMRENTIFDVLERGAHCSESDPQNNIGRAEYERNIILAANDRCVSVNTNMDEISVLVDHNLLNGDTNIRIPDAMVDKVVGWNREDFPFENFVDYSQRNLRLKYDFLVDF